ncbi:MAG: hypothetical protein RML15_05500 [Bacteroidota bacterium]|nr:hypothetical protein [Bacteroidota bacterium]MDW8271845.1 hypothetical protein [Bacteroidota bacterium]
MKHWHIISVLWLLGMLGGCATPPPPPPQPTQLPSYNLGAVNTPGDDIAPYVHPSDGLLYFTTDGIRDSVRHVAAADAPACLVRDQDFAVARSLGGLRYDTARLRGSALAQVLSVLANNEGNIAFRTMTDGFFASGHPFEETYARRVNVLVGGLVGGTDLFRFWIEKDGKVTVQNLQPLNSFYWDAHPAVALRNDTTLLVFSSDRPAKKDPTDRTRGLSAPFRNQRSFDGKDTVLGNADLYAAFMMPTGQWSRVVNLNDVLGVPINSRGNEYSPFLFCLEREPVLLFASDRRAGASPTDTTLDSTLNLWMAHLSVDYGRQQITVRSLEQLPMGTDTINSRAYHEMFPFIPHPHLTPTGAAVLLFASDRDDTVRHWANVRLEQRKVGNLTIRNRGGFDLYAIPIETNCRPPRVFYTVSIVDRQDPTRPIPQPVIVLEADDGTLYERRASTARFELTCGKRYRTRGGSLYDSVVCDPTADRVLSHYAQRRIVEMAPRSIKRVIERQVAVVRTHDTLRRTMLIPAHLQQEETFDTSAFETLARLSFAVAKDAQFVGIRRRSRELMDALFARPRIEPDTIMRTVRETITLDIPQYDTLLIPLRQELVLSELSKRGMFPTCDPTDPNQQDVELYDTIYIEPQYYVFPPCERVYVRDTQFVRNVPYFQTTFWEVNTSRGLAEHLVRFRTAAYRDAGFIELHRSNQYWGPEAVLDSQLRARREHLLAERIEQYRHYARYVDRNYATIVRSVCDTLLPGFADMLARLQGDTTAYASEKLIISVVAYSDARPIRRGLYLGAPIEYFPARFDTGTFRLEFPQQQAIVVRTGASLVGTDNDTLSKLRAYYGYTELLARLRNCPLFVEFERRGQVLLPTDVRTREEFESRLQRSRIVFVVEGRYADTTVLAQTPAYAALRLLQIADPETIAQQHSNDYFKYDNVRRVDVTIHRASYSGGMLRRPLCGCSR